MNRDHSVIFDIASKYCISDSFVDHDGGKEIPLIQGKEQWLCFAGAAVKIPHTQDKRNPSKMVGVARGHQRTDTLKP